MKPNHTLAAVVLFMGPFVFAIAQNTDSDAKELVDKAQASAKAQKFDEAVVLMKKALELASRNDQYLGMTSEFEYKAGKYADGLQHALEAIKLNDKVGTYYVLAAAHSMWLQDLDRARDYCDVVVKRGKEFGPRAVQDALMFQDQMGKKTFTLFYNLDPKKGRMVNGALSVAMPRDGLPYQSASYEISGAKSHKLVKGDVDDILQVVPIGTKPFTLTIKIATQPHSYKYDLAKASAKPLPADARANLGSIFAVDPKSPTLQKAAAGLKGEDTQATVRNILDWLKKNIDYKLEKKSINELDFKSVDEIVKRGHAECRGHALLFTALCRACDIPARPIWGILRVPPGGELKYGEIVSHNWAEVYVSGAGWVPIDPQRPETFGFLPNYYMRMFMDAQKTKTSTEALPVLNLMYMHGGKLRFEEARGGSETIQK
jgi:tetratricopeptide (TPR) repeat protein